MAKHKSRESEDLQFFSALPFIDCAINRIYFKSLAFLKNDRIYEVKDFGLLVLQNTV